MNRELTLLILAGGKGSRFGGMKQTEEVGPNGEYIIDYSIYDALRAGFTKVVFVIGESHYKIFKESIGKRIQDKVEVQYVLQTLVKDENGNVIEREKPWGTGHAVLSAKKVVKEPFLLINADDFYGYESFKLAAHYLRKMKEGEAIIIGYPLTHTLSSSGEVKRGICLSRGEKFLSLVESKVKKQDDLIEAFPLDGSESFLVGNDTYVSMNMIGFHPSIFKPLERDFERFFQTCDRKNSEYLIPNALEQFKNEKLLSVSLIKTPSHWVGMTYKEDVELVKKEIWNSIQKGIYKENLWGKNKIGN